MFKEKFVIKFLFENMLIEKQLITILKIKII